jgi:hypothetical protein
MFALEDRFCLLLEEGLDIRISNFSQGGRKGTEK